MSVSWSRVLASAAGVRVMKVSAMGPKAVRIIVLVGGSWWTGSALGVTTIVGTWSWYWGCRQVLSSEGLGYTLLNHCTHVQDGRADGWVCDNAE